MRLTKIYLYKWKSIDFEKPDNISIQESIFWIS